VVFLFCLLASRQGELAAGSVTRGRSRPRPRQRQVLRQVLGRHHLQLPLWWPWAAASSPPPFDGLLLPLSSSASVRALVFFLFSYFQEAGAGGYGGGELAFSATSSPGRPPPGLYGLTQRLEVLRGQLNHQQLLLQRRREARALSLVAPRASAELANDELEDGGVAPSHLPAQSCFPSTPSSVTSSRCGGCSPSAPSPSELFPTSFSNWLETGPPRRSRWRQSRRIPSWRRIQPGPRGHGRGQIRGCRACD